MKVRLVDGAGPLTFRKHRSRQSQPDRYPHGIQILDIHEQLRRFGLPPIGQSYFSKRDGIPEIHVKFANPPRDGEDLTLNDVKLRSLPYKTKHRSLNALLVFDGLHEALAAYEIRSASRVGHGDETVALRVELLGLDKSPEEQSANPPKPPAAQESKSSLLTAVDLGEPPGRVGATITRIVRDTALAAWVKDQHGYRCQICGETILLADGSCYAEGHHIRPLGKPHDGPDVAENILCLCPNHHATCDFGAIRLDCRELRSASKHKVAERFIAYHNERIYRG